MKKQIIIINGGTTFDKYTDYISSLKNTKLLKEYFYFGSDWKSTISKRLGEDFEVLIPRMPNSNNAKFNEWKIWFERLIPFMQNNVVLVGHSLGGIFLAKYLSTNKIPKSIKAIFLLAAPYDETGLDEILGSFQLPKSLNKLNNSTKSIFLLQSIDDPIVPKANAYKYHKELSNAKVIMFKDKGHFNQNQFPELERLIRKLYV